MNVFNWASRLFQKPAVCTEVLPKAGLVVSEKGNLTEILCKPKILPLKSITLQKLEEMEVSRNGGWLESRSVRSMSHGHHAWRRAMRRRACAGGCPNVHAPLSPAGKGG